MKNPKAYWQPLAARFDALNLRERLLIFAMAAMLLFALTDAVLLSPVRTRQNILAREILGLDARTKAVEAQIREFQAGQQLDPDAQNRAKIEALKQQLAKSDASLQGMQQNLVAPDKMGKLLEDLLARNHNLRLVSLKTLPVGNFDGAKPPEKSPGTQTSGLLYKHGVEITIEGSYGELLTYLTSVEQLPWHMLWGKIALHASDYPRVTLTLTLYTLSLNKAWLSV